jgi:hypothetical protein
LIIVWCLVALTMRAVSVNAGPIDFLKRVGHSIARSSRHSNTSRRTTQKQQAKSKPSARQLTRRDSKADNFAYTKGAQPGAQPPTSDSAATTNPSPSPAEAMPPRVSSAQPAGAAVADLPFGVPVPNRPGFVVSPYSPSGGYVDVQGFTSGMAVKDPYTGKVFRVP